MSDQRSEEPDDIDEREPIDHGTPREVGESLAVPSNWKVLGEIDDPGGTGVLGRNTATSGAGYGLAGTTSQTTTGAAGVLAESQSGNAKAIRARARNGGIGIYATSDGTNTFGVWGVNQSSDGGFSYGVRGETFSQAGGAAGVAGNSRGTSPAQVYGVRGDVSNRGSDFRQPAGVYGRATSASGRTYGVRGETRSGDVDAAGVKGEGTANAPAVRAAGHVTVDKVGLSAYRLTNQSIAGDGTNQTVVFDALRDGRDDFGGYDTSTGEYTVQVPGDYHVDFCIDWATTFSEGTRIDYNLQINGSTSGGIGADKTTATTNAQVVDSFSKGLFGLSTGVTIEVAVSQNSGSDKDVFGDSGGQTYLTIHRIG